MIKKGKGGLGGLYGFVASSSSCEVLTLLYLRHLLLHISGPQALFPLRTLILASRSAAKLHTVLNVCSVLALERDNNIK